MGPFIVHRNRKRLLLSQSTLREEFVQKKYYVFDIIGLPSEPLIPGGASLKVVEFWQSANYVRSRMRSDFSFNIGAASVCSSVRGVQKLSE